MPESDVVDSTAETRHPLRDGTPTPATNPGSGRSGPGTNGRPFAETTDHRGGEGGRRAFERQRRRAGPHD
ncbi:hypothetical protein DQW50_12125 [Halorubrum sp. 48-1-W]|uniref:hypothetical protein n=1 Tax=Halorubrum sp. 48-1-W TaxID=2249761 RepID=UPI000DCEE6A0|nr:hypothetical protein [Halorubrum sp. 48-1-W]RAW44906.1 hypothetical protein DQW50_12125 [Halorubrum sp. 48-1-W]